MYYNEERLHSALNYLRPMDYYEGNPKASLTEWKRKLTAATAGRKDVNRRIDVAKTRVGGVSF